MDRIEAIKKYYNSYNEDARLAYRHGNVEFITTVNYIEKYLSEGMRILEIGAGSGRYSHYFARHGYAVDAVELTECNIEAFKANTQADECVTVTQGDAIALDIADGKYDITLLLGPMYHLYTEEEQKRALSEAIRVTKAGGTVFVAYCGMDVTMYQFCIGRGVLKSTVSNGKIENGTFKLLSTPEDIFQLHRKSDIETLTADFDVTRLHYVGTDLLVRFVTEQFDALDDEDFAYYMRYHLAMCERPDMVGATNHILDILKKN